jgi:hypothetical protein
MLSLLTARKQPSTSQAKDRSAEFFGERAAMPNAYIIEVHDRTAGIVARDERGFRFFSSERLFDSLEGRQFRSARDAERAARALFSERRHLLNQSLFAS